MVLSKLKSDSGLLKKYLLDRQAKEYSMTDIVNEILKDTTEEGEHTTFDAVKGFIYRENKKLKLKFADGNKKKANRSNTGVIHGSNSSVISNSNTKVMQSSNADKIQAKEVSNTEVMQGGNTNVIQQNKESNTRVMQHNGNKEIILDDIITVIENSVENVILGSDTRVIQDTNIINEKLDRILNILEKFEGAEVSEPTENLDITGSITHELLISDEAKATGKEETYQASIKINKVVWTKFNDFCKKNTPYGVKKQDILSQALLEFVNKFQK